MKEAQFSEFMFWGFQALLAGGLGLLMSVLAWVIANQLKAQREFFEYQMKANINFVTHDEMREAFKAALAPFLVELRIIRRSNSVFGKVVEGVAARLNISAHADDDERLDPHDRHEQGDA